MCNNMLPSVAWSRLHFFEQQLQIQILNYKRLIIFYYESNCFIKRNV